MPTFNPQTGSPLVLTVEIAGLTGTDGSMSGLVGITSDTSFTHGFGVFVQLDGRLSVSSLGNGTFSNHLLTTLSSYSGQAITIVAELSATTFSVSTDVDSFSSGNIAYTTAFSGTGFDNLTDLGSSAMVWTQATAVASLGGSVEFDRIAVSNSTNVVPEPTSSVLFTLGIVGLVIIERRRRRKHGSK